MSDDRLRYALQHFFSEKFTYETNLPVYELEETAPEGKSRLTVDVGASESICVANYDDQKKFPKWGILNSARRFHLTACIDHFILRKNPVDNWELHMFEMKRSVGSDTWWNIKYKMRSSYLSIKAIAVYLGIDLDDSNITAYTTFKKEKWNPSEMTAPVIVVPKIGERAVDVKKAEWDTGFIEIPMIISDTNFHECLNFIKLRHKKIQMKPSSDDEVLEGRMRL